MKSVLFVLPVIEVDDSILIDSISAYVGAKSCSNQIKIRPFAVKYGDIDDDTFAGILSYVSDVQNNCIGIIVYGESPSRNLLKRFCEKGIVDIPVIAVACVSEFKYELPQLGTQYCDFAFRMWFDIPSLVYTIRQMIGDAPLDTDDGLWVVYDENEYGTAVQAELAKALSRNNQIIQYGQINFSDLVESKGVVLTGFGSIYDACLSKLDEMDYRGLIFTDNYLTEKHYSCKNLRICGLVVDDAVPDIKFSDVWEELGTELNLGSNSERLLGNGLRAMGVEPPIYFASHDAVNFLVELLEEYGPDSAGDTSGDTLVKIRKFILRRFQKKQYKNISLGTAMIHPLGECKISIRYRWIGPINFESKKHVDASQEKVSALFDEVESSIMSSGSVGELSYGVCDAIFKRLNAQLDIDSMYLYNLPDEKFDRYSNRLPALLPRSKAGKFYENELGPECTLSRVFKYMASRLPIQLVGTGRVLADNDALSLYVAFRGDNRVDPISVSADCDRDQVCGFIFAKTRLAAAYLWSKRYEKNDDIFLTTMRREDGLVISPEQTSDSEFVIFDKSIFTSLLNSIPKLLSHASEGFEYIVPEIVSGQKGALQEKNKEFTFAVFRSKRKLNKLELSALVNVTYRMFSLSYISSYIATNRVANTKSAIGSIMSRNGSHNIGSHVLAALSHNVGTMPDDRVLYQYIQHRMDYIATATTERPTWTMPTKFVSSMMRRFMAQRHLLDFISRSEGLRAYQFQNPQEDTTSPFCQPGTIRLHIRRINDEDGGWNREKMFFPEKTVEDFVVYPEGKKSSLDKDVDVAIPGGVVGQHAFFTILENILRNAAKHEWAVLQEVDKVAEAKDTRDVPKKKSNAKFATPDVISTQPGLVMGGLNAPSAGTFFYGTPTDVLDETQFAVAGKTVRSVSQTIVDSEGRNANDKFTFTDYSEVQTGAVAGKVKLVTKHNTPTGTYQVTLTATCDDGSKVKAEALTFAIRPPHLDVYVDFQDRPKEGKVDVVIWSDCDGKDMGDYLLQEEIDERLNKEVSVGELDLGGLSLLQRLQVKMVRPFIAADGHLHRENWGLAEMRISSGYLNCSKIEDIGGISKADARVEIISPVVVKTNVQEAWRKGLRHCLGYHFSIPKPKELLVILPDSMLAGAEEITKSLQADIERFSTSLRRFGVEMIMESMLENRKGREAILPFSYVLFSGMPGVLGKVKLPYRLLCASAPSSWAGAQYSGHLFERTIQDILSSDPELFVTKLLKEVYADWMSFVKARFRAREPEKRGKMDLPLVIDIYGQSTSDDSLGQRTDATSKQGNSSGAEQSLISEVELLDFIFKNTFNSAVDSYLSSTSAKNKVVRRGLTLWRTPGKREVQVEATRQAISEGGVVLTGEVIQLTRAEMIRRQLEKWCDRDYLTEDDKLCMQSIKAWLQALDVDPFDMDVPKELRDFIGYLGGVIFEQAGAFLCKYEERYVTLPEAMEVKLSTTDEKTCSVGTQRIIFTSRDDTKNSPGCANAIAYWRHENYKTERKNPPVYLEALSGAQSYFSVFSEIGHSAHDGMSDGLNREETRLVAKLVECGLLKVLIVDERVSRFVAEHQDVKKAFSHIGIDVWDADSPQTIEMFKARDSLPLEEYDIAIVHQGIIDKRLHDYGTVASVEEFCRRMEEKVSYYAITTGRGTPATIPPDARVLPFSVVESTLFTRYPEKFILVDAIMNLLPIGGQEAQ